MVAMSTRSTLARTVRLSHSLLDLHFSFSPLGSGVLRSYVAIDSSELS